jgi:Regulator of chromosome condensation (RCC1) repeat
MVDFTIFLSGDVCIRKKIISEIRKVSFLFFSFLFVQNLIGDGNIYSWGRGMFGRLGTGKEADELIPVKVSFTHSSQRSANLYPQIGDTKNPKFVKIAAGAYHSLALAGKEHFFCYLPAVIMVISFEWLR